MDNERKAKPPPKAEPTPFERMKALTRRIVSIPKSEIMPRKGKAAATVKRKHP